MSQEVKIAAQTLFHAVPNEIEVAKKYFSILSVLKNMDLTPMEINILAFTVVRGTITPPSARKEFITLFNSSLASLENVKGQLVKKGHLVKVDGMYRVNEKIRLNLTNGVILKIMITKHGNNQGNTERQTKIDTNHENSNKDS